MKCKVKMQATDLPARDVNPFGPDSSDSYSKIFVDGTRRHKTEVKNNELFPIWEPFRMFISDGALKIGSELHLAETFAIKDLDVLVKIEIWDEDLLYDDYLGQVEIKLRDFLRKGTNRYRVLQKNGQQVVECSELRIDIVEF